MRSIQLTDQALQYLVELLKTRPIAEALPLFEDIRGQVEAQDTRAEAEKSEAIRADERSKAASP